MGIFIAVYLLNQSLIHSLTIIRPGVLGYSSEITIEKVINLTNLERQKNNLPSLKYNPTLSQSAVLKAQDMFTNNYWAHTSPQGKTPWDYFRQVDYQYSVAGENLAKDFYDTEGMVKAWMNSPTHKANILNPKYQEIGIAVVNGVLGGVKTTLVVQHFATPINPDPLAFYTPPTSDSVSEVLANQSRYVSPLQLSKIVGAVMFSIILLVLIIDACITLKNRTHRLTGSSTSHIGFLAIILLLMLFTRGGSIF